MKRLLWLGALLVGCGEPEPDAPPPSPVGAGGSAGAPAAVITGGEELRVTLPSTGRAYARLASPPSTAAATDAWDLAFEGLDAFTNSGPSGSGQGAAFGPLDVSDFERGVVPEIPFTTPDRTGGAFLDWYAYEGAPAHVLWSRYHVYGIRDGERLWKVQILGYYGEIDGAPLAALYKVRYAELTADGVGATQEVTNLDATAGGPAAEASAPSECLDLGSGERLKLTPSEAQASSAWHLCFRRQGVQVNGDLGGPRGVGAVDLQAAERASEQIAQVKTRTAASEQARFDQVTRASFAASVFRGDGVVTAFSSLWLDGATPPAPATGSWLVVGADGGSRFQVVFTGFERATGATSGSVTLRVKQAK